MVAGVEQVARLIEHHPGRPPRVHVLRVGCHRLGRGPLVADLVLDHAEVSRVHAELRVELHAASIRDLGSTHGTWVGGREVAATFLADGDEIRIGPIRLVLDHPSARLHAALREAGEVTCGALGSARSQALARLVRRVGGPAIVALGLALALVALLLGR